MCELPPCAPCPPTPCPPCPQVCAPPPPKPPCRPKPIMRGLHWAQTQMHIKIALCSSVFAGTLVYVFLKKARMDAYEDFYAKAEMEEWAEEMALKGLFQSVPKKE